MEDVPAHVRGLERGDLNYPFQPKSFCESVVFPTVKIEGCADLICRAEAVKGITVARESILPDSYFCR